MKVTEAHPRWLLLALPALCLIALVLSIEPPVGQWLLLRLWVLTLAIAPGAALVIACAGFGSWLIPFRQANIAERSVFSLASGIMVLSSLAFITGMTGLTTGPAPLAIIGAGMIAGALRLRMQLTQPPDNASPPYLQQSRPTPDHPNPANLLPRLSRTALTFLLSAAAILIAIVSLTPPLTFDVTEYHLGASTSYAYGYIPMPFNFYARFPFPIESIYFLGLGATPSVDTAPKLFNAACVAACGGLAWLFVRRLGGGTLAASLGALLALAHPVMLEVSIDAMIDAPIALLVAGSLYTGLLAGNVFSIRAPADLPPEDRARWLIPSLLLFGTALSAKYTVAQLYLLPWILVIFIPLIKTHWRTRPGFLLGGLSLAAIPCLLWFGKNLAWYHNPLEPFFQSLFVPADAAAAAREKFYTESHFPQSPLSAVYWTSLLPRLHDFGWVILAACLVWIYKSDRRPAIRLALFSAIAFMLWNTVRASEDRFLIPVFLVAGALAVAGADAIP